MLSTSPSRPAVCRSIRFSCSDSLTVTQPLPDWDSISFLRCYQAHNYSHARLQMSVYLCQFSPVRICVSTPHRCLSLQTVQAAAHENFHPCLHLKGSFGCTIASHVRVVKSKASILFYFISVDSFLFLCVCFVTVSLGRERQSRCCRCCHAKISGLWRSVSYEVWLLLRAEASFLCGRHVTACLTLFQVMEFIAHVSYLEKLHFPEVGIW